ncbi:MAG: hypothetical protein ACFB20_02120 [Opitutales bacterium]
MSENSGENPSEALNQGIDLSELQNLSFGPDWTETTPTREHRGRSDDRGDRGGERGRGGPPRKDRRSGGRPERRAPSNRQGGAGGEGPRRDGGFRGGGERGPRDGGRRGGGRQRDGGRDGRGGYQPPFQPTVDVLFYPEDIPFRALTKALRASLRTYELFEIARLILDKPDRFVVVIKQKGSGKGGHSDDGDASSEPKEMAPDAEGGFLMTLPDHVPFDSEDAALGHVLKHHLDRFFRTEEVEVDPPKGSFQFVNRCSISGELLGPPNYHRYQAIVQAHHAARLPHMSFERFAAKIEQVREQEVIDQWVQQMTKETRYILNEPTDDAPPFFDSAESAKHYLATQQKSKILRRVEAPRMSGKQIEKMPDGDLRRSIEAMLEQQKRFPLDTANNLRGRLRRMRFNIYKRGSKGVSYVSAVKRRFRDEKTRFSESLEGLIQFIEAHPNISIAALPEQYLGFDLDQLRQPLPGSEPASPSAEAAAPVETPSEVPSAVSTASEAPSSAPDAATEPTEASAEAPSESPPESLPEKTEAPAEIPASDVAAEAPASEAVANDAAQSQGTDADAPGASAATDSVEAKPAETEATAEDAPSSSDAPAEGETAEPEPATPAAASSPDDTSPTENAAAADTPAAEPKAAPPRPAAAKPQDEFPSATPEQKAKIRQLSSDLRWLVAEGYVTEFGDGTLFAPPVMATPKPKAEPAPKTEADVPASGEGDASASPPSAQEATAPDPAAPAEPPPAEPSPVDSEPALHGQESVPGEQAEAPVAEAAVAHPQASVEPPAGGEVTQPLMPDAVPAPVAPVQPVSPVDAVSNDGTTVPAEHLAAASDSPVEDEKPTPVSAAADSPKEKKTS